MGLGQKSGCPRGKNAPFAIVQKGLQMAASGRLGQTNTTANSNQPPGQPGRPPIVRKDFHAAFGRAGLARRLDRCARRLLGRMNNSTGFRCISILKHSKNHSANSGHYDNESTKTAVFCVPRTERMTSMLGRGRTPPCCGPVRALCPCRPRATPAQWVPHQELQNIKIYDGCKKVGLKGIFASGVIHIEEIRPSSSGDPRKPAANACQQQQTRRRQTPGGLVPLPPLLQYPRKINRTEGTKPVVKPIGF